MRGKKDARFAVVATVAALAAANLVAAAIAFQPWGSSVEDLERQAGALRTQIRQQRTALERAQSHLKKVDVARVESERFVDQYLLGKASLASTLAKDLEQGARKAGIRQKDTTFSFEPIEGSETLTRAIVTGTYEGTYGDLVHFLNQLDHSDRLLIVEGLNAAPQQGGQALGVTLRLSSVVREGGPLPVEEQVEAMAPAQAAPAPVAQVPAPRQAPVVQAAPPPPVAPPKPPAPGEGGRGFMSGPPPRLQVGPLARPRPQRERSPEQ